MLPVPFAAQISESACLPACAQMVLNYLGRGIDQAVLTQFLGTTDAGTPFSRLHLLEQLGLAVDSVGRAPWFGLTPHA
jgi:ABC-type bacteriocin/lantibiotic exporter with double-glycine peptidase domain